MGTWGRKIIDVGAEETGYNTTDPSDSCVLERIRAYHAKKGRYFQPEVLKEQRIQVRYFHGCCPIAFL